MMISPCCAMNTIPYYGGIWIDEWMLGIGKVWYFSSKIDVFHEMMASLRCVLNSIVYYFGIWIDEWMLGIGEVWYISSKTVVFSRNDDFTTLCDEQHCVLWWYLYC